MAAPGARYRAGSLHAFFLGANYRSLWATPIRVEVLDLSTAGGGLTPTEKGGGLQTASLRFKGGDGREYVFREIDKDPSRALPEELRETVVEGVYQDQVSAFHPAAAVVVARLLDATRIRHARPRLVVMPDDARLGEFRAEFAGDLGIFEERAEAGFDETETTAGAARVISSENLLERLSKNSNTRVHTRAFLAARLFDVFVGDRDRHRDQWRWAQFGDDENAPWEPIPRDRDMAFVRHEGVFPRLAKQFLPQIVSFDEDYPEMARLNWNAREMDRRLLVALERPVWDSVAQALEAQLTDSVIADAINAMPAEFVRVDGRRLRAALIYRRDHLREAANDFYELLAEDVDFTGTNDADLVEVTRNDDGTVDVALSDLRKDGAPRTPYLSRRFVPKETHEVRVYLGDGDDRAMIRGGEENGITVRVIGGDGDDELTDASRFGAKFYDSQGNNRLTRGPRTSFSDRRYTPPKTLGPHDPPRDWGHRWRTLPWISHAPEIGFLVGASVRRTEYGFRADPFLNRVTLRGGYALEANKHLVELVGERRWPNSQNLARVELRASGIEVVRFYGFGNETTSEEDKSFYKVFQTLYLIEPSLLFPLSSALTLSVGAAFQTTDSETRSSTLLGQTRPYGSGEFAEMAGRLGVTLDTRDDAVYATRGVHATLAGSVFPSAFDVSSTFSEVHGSLATFATAKSLNTTLALRVAGKHVFGTFPFFESAFVGGSKTLRGWSEQRFAGRSAVYGNAELRLFLTKFRLFVPNDFGIFGLADVGRVYLSAEESNTWHTGFGGGIWVAPVWRSNTVSAAVVHGKEKTGFYLRSGFLF